MQKPGCTPASSTALRQPASLKVCLVTCFPPSQGDLNEYGFHVASALRSDPTVDLLLLADEMIASEEIDGFKVERCWRFDSLLTPVRLLAAIRKANPDVVWFNMGFSTFARRPIAAFFSITGPALARLSGFYTHVTLHTLFDRINLKDAGVRMPRIYRLAGRIATRFLLCAHDVSVLLPSFRSELVEQYRVDGARVHSRPHGTFSRRIPSAEEANRREHVILAFGYWGTYKRLELVLEHLDSVVKEVPDTVLLIAGTNHPSKPGYMESLQARYGDRPYIRFLGYVPETQLPELFQQASVLVLPYTSAAGTSGVVHQACEYGLPMVAAAIPELQEVAREHGISLLLYPPGDGNFLSKQLVRLLKSDELRSQITQQNLSAGKNMQISQVVGGYLTLFRERAQRSHILRITRARHSRELHSTLDHSVGSWLLHSGIEERSGGVARYYLSDSRRNKPVSTEITGYCASALAVLYDQTGEERYWDAALRKAKFLTKKAWDSRCAAMPFECEAKDQSYSYFFDTGIIVRGLLALWRKCGQAALLSLAVKCGESMARDFFDGKNFSPIITLPDKMPLTYEFARWSRSPGCYQLKSAMGWWELWEATHSEQFRTLYEQFLDASLQSQHSFLPGVDDESAIMDRLHPYAYFLEGLLPAIEEPECRKAMQRGIPLLAAYAREIAPTFLRSDVMAQLLRVRIFADCFGVVPLDSQVGALEVAIIKEFQSFDQDPRLKGGFWFGRKEGKMLPFMNPVSSVFCYQAVEMWERYRAGERQFQWQNLI